MASEPAPHASREVRDEVERQLALIRRGVEQVVPEDQLREKLTRSITHQIPLRVKYGIDPTGISVHLGHTVPLRKLRLFQTLGHQAVLIIGNYTALVGDPSGRDETRARLTREEVENNARDYLFQISKIIDISRTEVAANGAWFGRFNFMDVLRLTGMITVQRLLERDDFTKRLKAGTPIYLHECLYPLMQGFDSVMIKADVELGGSEQLFSLMAGRDLQRDPPPVPDYYKLTQGNGTPILYQGVIGPGHAPLSNMMVGREVQRVLGQEPQVCVTLPILRGLDGERRMGKSLGNYIGVAEPPYDQFAKVMSIPDALMQEWFELLTDRGQDEIATLLHAERTHPMEAKKTLGRDIVGFYYGDQAARVAQQEWERRFSERKDPTEIPEVAVAAAETEGGRITAVKLLVAAGLAKSNNEARRLLQGGGVTIGPERAKVTEPTAVLLLPDGLIVRVGSKKVIRIRLR